MSTKTSFRVDGKVALVTGAGRGLGASCARILAEAGAKVMLTDIVNEQAEAVVEDINSSGGQSLFRQMDVVQEEHWVSTIEETVKAFGGFDIVVNNAGVESMNLVEDHTLEDWRKVMSVNLEGVFLGTKHAIRAMKPGGIAGKGGSIIQMCSICAMVGLEGAVSYSAAKAGVRMLTKVAAIECGKLNYGIRVNSLHPGVILTELTKAGMEESAKRGVFKSASEAQALYESMHPIGRLGEPIDIANATLYLASDASSFVTGSELVVDGGLIAQ